MTSRIGAGAVNRAPDCGSFTITLGAVDGAQATARLTTLAVQSMRETTSRDAASGLVGALASKQAPELVDGEGRPEPLPPLTLVHPDAEIRVAALVPGAGMDDFTE